MKRKSKLILIGIFVIVIVVISAFMFAGFLEEDYDISKEFIVKPFKLYKFDHHRAFFRIDDVGWSEETLVSVINVFLETEIPIALGVIPVGISDDTVDYLINLQNEYPTLIEIDMHSYTHRALGGLVEGEFKNRRRQVDIESELFSGQSIMNQLFVNWSYIFTVPFSAYDNSLINSLGSIEFNGLSSHYPENKIDPVVNHYPGLDDFSTCLDIVEDWDDPELPLLSEEEFVEKYEICRENGKSVGIMVHHHIFTSEEELEHLRLMITYVKNDTGTKVIRMQDLYLW